MTKIAGIQNSGVRIQDIYSLGRTNCSVAMNRLQMEPLLVGIGIGL
jgi:hypothetical protein